MSTTCDRSANDHTPERTLAVLAEVAAVAVKWIEAIDRRSD